MNWDPCRPGGRGDGGVGVVDRSCQPEVGVMMVLVSIDSNSNV